jgi:hypothetical protein
LGIYSINYTLCNKTIKPWISNLPRFHHHLPHIFTLQRPSHFFIFVCSSCSI